MELENWEGAREVPDELEDSNPLVIELLLLGRRNDEADDWTSTVDGFFDWGLGDGAGGLIVSCGCACTNDR